MRISPKDATLAGEKTKELFKEELSKHKDQDPNTQLIAYIVASGKALKVNSGNEFKWRCV